MNLHLPVKSSRSGACRCKGQKRSSTRAPLTGMRYKYLYAFALRFIIQFSGGNVLSPRRGRFLAIFFYKNL